MLKGKQ